MPLLRIVHYPGVRQVFIASEAISHLAVVEISSAGPQYVKSGVSGTSGRTAGVLYGAVTSALGSGKICRVVTQGIVSGVVCASSINAGDRVTLASGGRIAAFNTITPAGAVSGQITGAISGYITGAISGYIPAGALGLASGLTASGWLTSGVFTASGLIISGIVTIDTPSKFSSGAIAGAFSSGSFAGVHSGSFAGTAINTAQVLGKALASGGGLGSGIPILVTLGG